MTDVPFETRRLLRDLPDLLAGKEPVLTSDRGREHLHRDPVARGLFVTALEIGAALEGGAYARIPRRRVAPEILTSVDRARRFFRRRLVVLGQHLALSEFHRTRPFGEPFIENAETVLDEPGRAISGLASISQGLGLPDTEAELLLSVLEMRTAGDILNTCRSLCPGSELTQFLVLFMSRHPVAASAWLDLFGRCAHTEVAGWALVYAATAHGDDQRPRDALKALAVANDLLPHSFTCAFNRYYFALLAGDTRTAEKAAVRLGLLHALPPELVAMCRRPEQWCNFSKHRSNPPLDSTIHLLPAEMRHAIEESRQ